MRLGAALFVTDETVQPVELGRRVEQRGLDSLFLPEHMRIPTSRKTPHRAAGPCPRQYGRTVDPFVALAALATITITIGTSVCLLAQRDSIVTAGRIGRRRSSPLGVLSVHDPSLSADPGKGPPSDSPGLARRRGIFLAHTCFRLRTTERNSPTRRNSPRNIIVLSRYQA
jgi:hypothetical protein